MAKSNPYVSDSCVGIIKGLKTLADKHSIWSVFEDWLEVSAISISNTVDWGNREKREAQYLEKINKYTSDEQKILVKTFAELVNALENELQKGGPTDLLGRVFHGLKLHNKYHGQFFTPFHICEFMGRVVWGDGGDVDKALSEKGYVSVYEPAVGSGGMVIGFANAMHREKLNYCEQMVCYCCDIDIKCVYMTYLQLSLYGIPAVIIHGNSLTLEEWSKWYTPVYMLGGWPLKECADNILSNMQKAVKKQETPPTEEKPTENKTQDMPDYVVRKNGQLSLF